MRLNRSSLCRQYKSAPYAGNIQFYAEWRSVSGATPVFVWMRSLLQKRMQSSIIRLASFKGAGLWRQNHSVFNMEQKFSAIALSYGFPFLDMDDVKHKIVSA